jgi:hypothetical protein
MGLDHYSVGAPHSDRHHDASYRRSRAGGRGNEERRLRQSPQDGARREYGRGCIDRNVVPGVMLLPI